MYIYVIKINILILIKACIGWGCARNEKIVLINQKNNGPNASDVKFFLY